MALVDALAHDGLALLAVLEGRDLAEAVAPAAGLLATVLGQDLEETGGGSFVIARRVAKDRVISTVDPQTRHGHKTLARGFDGYKGHVAVDPDSEVITATEVSAGNAGDASTAEQLIGDLFDKPTCNPSEQDPAEQDTVRAGEVGEAVTGGDQACVYGDNAYGTGELHDRLERAGIESRCKTQAPVGAGGRFTKDRFDVDLDADTVTCPAGRTRRSGAAAMASAPLTSGRPAPTARCVSSARRPPRAAPSRSGSTSGTSPPPGPGNSTLAGCRTTVPPGPRWNARSLT